MQVGEKIVKLRIRERGAGHRPVAVKDGLSHAFVGGRRTRWHGLDLGDGLQARAVKTTRTGGVVALGAGSLIDLRTACFLLGPLGRRLRRRQ